MIPVSLTLKGLYSYQQEQTIDFNRLLDGQVFGIFGAVGSGKSTILEAISFALYGETERLNQRDNRNYNMMNLKSNELLIDFIFANFDNTEYRFTVKGKRAGNDFETVRTFQRSAYKKVNDHWEPLEETSAEPVIGLSYDNFRRTIIIPQGKFQEFLQLGDKARTDMLKEIFHLGKYEFFYQTASLEKKNNEKAQHLRGQLERYNETTADAVETKQTRVEELKSELDEIRMRLQQQEKQEKALAELKKIFEELSQKKEELEKLKSQEDHYKKQEKKLHDYEYCLRNFKDKLARQKELRNSINSKNKTILESNELLSALSGQLVRQETQWLEVKEEIKKQDSRKDLLNDYRHLQSILELEKEIETLQKRAADGNEYVIAESKKKAELQQKLDKQKSDLKAQKSALPDMKTLSEVNQWFLAKEHLYKTKTDIAGEIAEAQKSLSEYAEELSDHLPSFLAERILETQQPAISAYLKHISEYTEASHVRLEKLQQQVNHYQVQMKLGEYAEKLHAGEACPLCGSKEHSEILSVENVNEHLEKAGKEIEQVKNNLKICDKASGALRELQIKQQNKQHQLDNLSEKREDANEKLKAHEELFLWKNFNPEKKEEVTKAFVEAENITNEIRQQETAIETTEKELQANSEKFEKYKTAVENIKNEVTAKASSLQTIQKQLKVLKPEEQRFSPATLQEKAQKLAGEIKAIDKRHEQLSKTIEQQRQNKIALQERTDAARQVLAEEGKLLENLEKDLKKCLEKSAFGNWQEIEAILEDQLDIDVLRNELTEYQQRLYKSRQDVDHLEKQTKDRPFDPEKYQDLLGKIASLREDVQQVNDECVKETDALERLKNDLQTKEKLEKGLEALQHRAANLSTLRQIFKGSGFINYISSVYLHNLCQAANERFYKLTRQQLRLEVTESNDFQVRDFLNNGKTRSVKTLSGGQTFQASLSLALALAESVQHQNKARQNFFFLDEGFGSLDKESLQIVFDTLKSLRKENRIVGIISHVEDLQQEIDVYLKIINHPETGSLVKRSWSEA